MRRLMLLLSLVVACGPTPDAPRDGGGGGDGGGNLPDAYFGPVGAITGTVWAPGNGPGDVPAGHEIPISGALVYLSFFPPDPIPQEVYCEPCEDPPGGAVFSDAHGAFALTNIRPETYWLVIQKGQFRLEQLVAVGADETIVVPPAQSTLPSRQDPANGMWIPRIALAEGLWDNMEEILGKMGIGAVDSSGAFISTSAAGNFDLYINGSGDHGGVAIGDLNALIGDLARMLQYHIIFIPCSNGDNSQLFASAAFRQNIRDYVAAGGKFYVTDWSSEWEDAVFPEFIQFTSDHDTPAGATSGFNDGDGFPGYESDNARADDPDLHEWMVGQQGPLAPSFSPSIGAHDPDSFVVEGNWNHIEQLPDIVIGVDDEGFPVHEQAHAFVLGDWTAGEPPVHPLTVTFEPIGCGRVLYSTYHTAENVHVGLVPQERILLYLIMEIGLCKSGPIIG